MENNASSNMSTGPRITRNCSRCRNHGLKISQKGHTKDCMYRNCVCEWCKLFSNRRSTMSTRIRQEEDLTSISTDGSSLEPQSVKNLEGSYDSNSGDLSLSNHGSSETQEESNDVIRITSSKKAVSSNLSSSATKSWLQWQPGTMDSNISWDASSTSNSSTKLRTKPTCKLCRNHKIINILKGHKRYCHFLYCTCLPCREIHKHRKKMAKQIALKRELIQDEEQIRKFGKLVKLKKPTQEINHLPIVSQPAWNVESNYGGGGINNLISTPTLRKVPVDTIIPPLIQPDLIQPHPSVNVKIILARSMTLLEQFRYPWDILTLMYVTVKYAGANLEEALRRIDEVEHWILDVYSMLERYIKNYILFVLYKILTIYTSLKSIEKLMKTWNVIFLTL